MTAQPLQFSSKHSTDVQSTANSLYPRGLSSQGQKYLLSDPLLIQIWVAPIVTKYGQLVQTGPIHPETVPAYSMVNDLILELVRRADSPDKPSRYETFFAWNDEATARRFAQKYNTSSYKIFEVCGEPKFCADMLWTKLGFSAAEAWHNARQYWAGAPRENQLWEHFLAFPVQVVAEIP